MTPITRWTLLAAAALTMIGSALVWVSITHPVTGIAEPVRGVDADGVITMTLAVLVALIALTGWKAPAAGVVSLLLGLLSLAIALNAIGQTSDVAARLQASGLEVGIGIGVILTAVGSAAITVLGVLGWRAARVARRAAVAAPAVG